jgi:hypothetical protein
MVRTVAVAVALLMGMAHASDAATIEHRGNEIVFAGADSALAFSDANGSIQSVTMHDERDSILRSSAEGLWWATYKEGGGINAADFAADSPTRLFRWSADAAAGTLHLNYTSDDITVGVTIVGRTDGADFTAHVEPARETVLEFALPARLRFDPDQIERLVCPLNANESVGAAFRPAFFERQSADQPAGWRTQMAGPSGFTSLLGTGIVMRADNDPPVPISITPDGRGWLGSNLAHRWDGKSAIVNRPSPREQATLVLADSPNGPFFSGTGLGRDGFLFRIGGRVETDQAQLTTDLVIAALEHLAQTPPARRSRIGLVALEHGPQTGGWTVVPVTDWRNRLTASAAIGRTGLQIVELSSARDTLDALAGNDFLAILNPYGEYTPVLEETGMTGTVAAIGRYVKAGGNWFEVGGYPFYYELRPTYYYSYSTAYPPAFADFLHLDAAGGSVSLYGVQPMSWAPWKGGGNPAAIFVPGRLAWGGDEQGGYCERAFGTYIRPGTAWQSPPVRLALGNSVVEDLNAYCQANQITRSLETKMSPTALAAFKQSVLVFFDGTCNEMLTHLDQLPAPALIHFARYLKGGFDKQYPDHLPPNPGWGTPAEFQALLARCRELGHLVMPYTNPTWWCDHPRGPTFLREGEAPLLRRPDGSLSYELYGANDGYTVCHWHPAVQAANRLTVRQFTDDYPVDVLFQDQCGARGWQYDMNPASPTPLAYSEGLVSMVAEDSQKKLLSTENGWDRIVNYESQLCGMTWSIVPTQNPPTWRTFLKERFPPQTWEIFPLAQYIAHDKAAMVHHDLGQFVTNDEVLAWTLGLGYSLSYRVSPSSLERTGSREWLRWLDRLQKSVCARLVGEPVQAFAHERGSNAAFEDDGLLRAVYGSVEVTANLNSRPMTSGGYELASYGFQATTPGVVAAHLKSVGSMDLGDDGVSFVVEGDAAKAEIWIYSRGDRDVAVEMPKAMTGPATLRMDGVPDVNVTAQGRTLALHLGPRPGVGRMQPPAALAEKSPQDWPGNRPALGVLNLPGMPRAWTHITSLDWVEAFQQSRLATEFGVPVRQITNVAELQAALQAGVTSWLAIVNPGGECFPVAASGQWRAMLELVRGYVNQGGCWWETAGYSFYAPAFRDQQGWQTETLGPDGMEYFGLPVGTGPVDQAPEPLIVTARGAELLGGTLSAALAGKMSAVNRWLPRTADAPSHFTLLAGAQQDFLGAYRLEGWGYLWRVGGFWPNPEVVLPTAVAAMEYLSTHPPLPVEPDPTRYLWHGVVSR